MPPAIVKKLNTTINEILSDPNFKKQYEAMGSEPDIKTPEQFAAMIKSDSRSGVKSSARAGSRSTNSPERRQNVSGFHPAASGRQHGFRSLLHPQAVRHKFIHAPFMRTVHSQPLARTKYIPWAKLQFVGAGNVGQAIAGHMTLLGHDVRLYSRWERDFEAITRNRRHRTIRRCGRPCGETSADH
jgi:hypothetical protein